MVNKLSICALAVLFFWLARIAIANAERLTCFADICIDSSSVELIKSDVPGAPSYAVRMVLGTQKFSDEKLLAQMEVNCQERQFRTVRVSEDGENWSNFDPRWIVIAGNSSLSRLVDYTCQLPIAGQ
ncbi:MAG: hypothetical protein HC849_07775 [Oscillatoriales cyanobacterium RU_3_3]|nr:hypothetical protein [Microcoleus sp. SM1_3_4]NJM60098.1 hypothetical protein [Oscillatoriales cyanobacterium RU_3_3]NJR24486.1 hypothetical protein [Richelia sp. CSU_2_1]